MPRSDDPLATFLYLVARNGLPWGAIEKLLVHAKSDAVPALPAGDPIADWARQQATELRTPVVD